MAQTGYTPILIYSSSTASQAPAAGNLTNSTLGSELAINITDGKLFYKDNGGSVQVIAWKTTPTTAGGTGLTSYTAGDLPYYASGSALSKLAIGANTYLLASNGTAPTWVAPSSISIGTASNLAGGAGGSVPYQSSANNTTFLAIGTSNYILTSSGTAPQWTQYLSIAQGGTNATSFTAVSGSISGLTYYNGTSVTNSSTVTDVGYDTTNLNVVARGYALSANGIITESTTSRTLSASDNGKVIYCTNGSTTTITTATGLGAGFSCTVIQGGAGKVTISQGASTTLVSSSGLYSTLNQYAIISIIAPVANTFVVAGNLGV